MIRIYTDGACQGNPGPGGWAAVILEDGQKRVLKGRAEKTTSNRMELTAAAQALAQTPEGIQIDLYSDSQYLVNSMTGRYRRKVNLDLWQQLDELATKCTIQWHWLPGHIGHPENEEAHRLANEMAGISPPSAEAAGGATLTHLDASGQAHMVDVSVKPETEREAVARGRVVMQPATLDLIKKGQAAKGDVLGVARLAGIMAAKETSRLIPLAHVVPLSQVAVEFSLNPEESAVEITATARATGKTGVEMEALVAVAVSALALYDMCKAVDRGMRLEGIRLLRKSGGRSGLIELP